MSEFLNHEETAYSNLKKLNSLLEDLSSNLSKDKTEKALKVGYDYIKEIEDLIDKMEKSKKEKYNNNNLFMIKDDFAKKKEKFENIQNKYILNKSNQLIDSLSDNISTKNDNNEELNNINNDISNSDNYFFEEDNDDKNYGKNFIDEYFKENKSMTDLSQRYLYNDNFIFNMKRIIHILCAKLYNTINKIPPKIKYLTLLIILMISLIFCIFGLYNSLVNSAI